MARPASSARADETSSAAEELSPAPTGTVLEMLNDSGWISTPRASELLRDADYVIGPMLRRRGERNLRRRATRALSFSCSDQTWSLPSSAGSA